MLSLCCPSPAKVLPRAAAPGLWCAPLAALALGCSAAGPGRAVAPHERAASARPSVRCQAEALGDSPFRDQAASHFLIADFRGMTSEVDLAGILADQVADQLTRYKEETLTRQAASQTTGQVKLDIEVPKGALEIQRLGCWVESHEHAEDVAKALGADVVLWGTAATNPTTSAPITVTNRSHNQVTGNVQGAHSTIKVGTVEIQTAKPYTVHPRATLWYDERSYRKSTERGMELMGITHLDLPALSQTQPFRVVEFALGLHFFYQENFWLAARFFQSSAEAVLVGQAGIESLDIILGRAYLALPDFERALKHTRRALERVRGTEQEAVCLNNIGSALLGQGAYEDALENYRRALSTIERARDPDDPLVANVLSNIAVALYRQSAYADSLAYSLWALTIRKLALGPDHPDVADALINVGVILAHQGAYADALENDRRALAIYERALGPDHPDVATALNNIGLTLHRQGAYADALMHYRRALAIYERALGPDHPDVANSLNNIGLTLHEQGDRVAAIDLLGRALAILEARLGSEHPDTLTVRGNLAITLAESSGWQESLKPRGAVVLRCTRGTCAGLATGDWIVAYNATQVRDVAHLIKLTGASDAANKVRVTVVRAGKKLTLTAPGGRLGVEIF